MAGYKKIKLTKNKYTIVDDDIFDYLNQWKWHYGKTGYAQRSQWLHGKNKNMLIMMHRLINNTPIGMITDHINQNKLDNRKLNLRTTNKVINALNSKLHNTNNSGYRGIEIINNRYRVRIYKNKSIHIGCYKNIKEAINARNEAYLKYFNFGFIE